jgi:hypothetical protein
MLNHVFKFSTGSTTPVQHSCLRYLQKPFYCGGLLLLTITLYAYLSFNWKLDNLKPLLENKDENQTEFDINVLNQHMLRSIQPDKLVVIPITTQGYANQLNNFFTGLFLSLTHNASFEMRWPGIDEYIDVRLSGFAFNHPPPATYTNTSEKKTEVFIRDTPYYVGGRWYLKKIFEDIQMSIEVNFSTFYLTDMRPIFYELACNPKHFDLLQNLKLVSAKTILKARQVYENNTVIMNNDEKIVALWQVGFEFASTTLNHIWRSNQAVQKIVDHYVNNHFKNYYVIGMQFRFLYMSLDSHELDNFINCALDIEQNDMNLGKHVRWFVTADWSKHLKRLFKKYSKYVITVRLRESRVLHYETGMSFVKTIVENELLSKCDELIVTGGSTYGFLAGIRANRMPLYFNGNKSSTSCPRNSFLRQGKRADLTDSGGFI